MNFFTWIITMKFEHFSHEQTIGGETWSGHKWKTLFCKNLLNLIFRLLWFKWSNDIISRKRINVTIIFNIIDFRWIFQLSNVWQLIQEQVRHLLELNLVLNEMLRILSIFLEEMVEQYNHLIFQRKYFISLIFLF
jgi:hypothetical protein